MDATVTAVVAAAVPTTALGVIGWSLRSWFEEIRSTMRRVEEKVGGHGERLAGVEARMAALEGKTERRSRR